MRAARALVGSSCRIRRQPGSARTGHWWGGCSPRSGRSLTSSFASLWLRRPRSRRGGCLRRGSAGRVATLVPGGLGGVARRPGQAGARDVELVPLEAARSDPVCCPRSCATADLWWIAEMYCRGFKRSETRPRRRPTARHASCGRKRARRWAISNAWRRTGAPSAAALDERFHSPACRGRGAAEAVEQALQQLARTMEQLETAVAAFPPDFDLGAFRRRGTRRLRRSATRRCSCGRTWTTCTTSARA